MWSAGDEEFWYEGERRHWFWMPREGLQADLPSVRGRQVPVWVGSGGGVGIVVEDEVGEGVTLVVEVETSVLKTVAVEVTTCVS